MMKLAKVSVWVGTVADRSTLDQLLEYSIEDGEFKSCEFCQSLGVDSYDPVNLGGRYFPKEFTNLRIMLRDSDIQDEVIARHPEIPPSNCIVQFYDFDSVSPVHTVDLNGVHFKFLGAYDYEIG